MAKVERLRSVLRALEKLERESMRKNTGDVIVGFSASYALHVHEAPMKLKGKLRGAKKGSKRGTYRGKFWDPQATARNKFLEEPARTKQREMAARVLEVARRRKSKMSLTQALLIAGLYLQREAQKLVPVETGNLKASAFTEKE
jgi:hypothetical protein